VGVNVDLLGVAAGSAFVQELVAARAKTPFTDYDGCWGEYYWLRRTGAWSEETQHFTDEHLALDQMLEDHPELWMLTWSRGSRNICAESPAKGAERMYGLEIALWLYVGKSGFLDIRTTATQVDSQHVGNEFEASDWSRCPQNPQE